MATWYIWFKDNRDPAANYTRYADVAEKPLVAGTHCYAVTGGVGVLQDSSSIAIADFLNGLAGKKTVKINSASKPVGCLETVDGKTRASGWFIGSHLIDGPLAGIKK